MDSWGNEQFNMMQGMMGMPQMMPNGMPHGPGMQPMPMPSMMMNDWNQQGPQSEPVMIGPVVPEPGNMNSNYKEEENNERNLKTDGRSRDYRRERDNDRGDRSRRRSRSQDHSSRDRKYGGRSRRDRRGKPDYDRNEQRTDGLGGPMMPGNNMVNVANMLNQQAMELGNMGNMPNMNNMQTMMPGMNMMQNMMDPNMMMHQQNMIANHFIYLNNGMLLPPVMGTTLPNRRSCPSGCRTIFIGGLPDGIGNDVIAEIFQRFGTIVDIKLHRQGVCHVRFEKIESVEPSFFLSGYRFKFHDQNENEATTLFIDYALNREDQNEYERQKRQREPTPPRIEPYSPVALTSLTEKIKSEKDFVEAAPTLTGWLERGECSKRNANQFYSLIQASNNQLRRLFNEKMQFDDEYQTLRNTMKDKFAHILLQFEQVAKILSAAKHQRVSDHFTKQQRRNIDMWQKMTEEVENIKEEFNAFVEDDDTEKQPHKTVSLEKYEELKSEHENLTHELEGYKNEAHLAKNEAERKFETFKAHFIAQQALQNKQVYPPLPVPIVPVVETTKPKPPQSTEERFDTSVEAIPPSGARLISILTAFLLVHPLGATLDYLVSYVRSMIPDINQHDVQMVLQKYNDVFARKTTGVGASMEHKWTFLTFEAIKNDTKNK